MTRHDPQTIRAAEPLPFDFAKLVSHLATHDMAVDTTQPPRRCAGGLANLNYEIMVDGAPVILRRAPSGPLPRGAHDMVREHRVLSRLGAEFPLAPQSLYLCRDPSVIGAPFQLIEFRKGRVIRGDDLSALSPGEDLGGALCGLLAEAMAGLHSVDPVACGLEGLGRHQGFLQRNATRWSKAAVEISTNKPFGSLANDVAKSVVDQFENWTDGPVTVLHCDIKLDNLILASDRLAPVALLDWDMATLGEPVFDLATLLSYWTEPGDPPAMQRLRQMPTGLAGFPGRTDMVQAYEQAVGRSLQGLEPARALCQLKLAVVFLQLHARWKDGAMGDDRYAEFETLGVDLLEFARDVATGKTL